MRAQISNRDFEQLSAFLDGQLPAKERTRLEERLRAHPELQAILDDLSRTKQLLRAAPRRRAPRNFMLTPAMVGQQKSIQSQKIFLNLFPALSFASGLALFALIFSLVLQLTFRSSASMTASQPGNEVAMAPIAAQTTESSSQDRAAKEGSVESPQGAVMESQEFSGTLTPEPAGKAAENFTAPETSPMNPPVIIWNNNPGYGGGGGGDGMASKSQGEYAPAPNATGIGGGAGDSNGSASILPDGTIVIPLEGVNSIEGEQPKMETTPPQAALETSPSMEAGSGPILGIPSAEEAGQIANSSSWGGPFQNDQITTDANELAVQQTVEQPRNTLLLIQIILAVIAVLTGAAAIVLWRRKRI